MAAKSVYEKFGTSALTGQAQSAIRHTVIGGETLSSIFALHFPDEGYSSKGWRQLAEANGITDPYALVIGSVLIVPSLKAV